MQHTYILDHDFFTHYPFMPHAVCWQWDWRIILLHGSGDFVTWVVYTLIPIIAIWIYRKANLKALKYAYPRLWLRGAGFVFFCGLSHLGSFLEIWYGDWIYFLTGVNKGIMALASVLFAVELWRRRLEIAELGRVLNMVHNRERTPEEGP